MSEESETLMAVLRIAKRLTTPQLEILRSHAYASS